MKSAHGIWIRRSTLGAFVGLVLAACGSDDGATVSPEASESNPINEDFSEAYEQVAAPGKLELPKTGYSEPLTSPGDLSQLALTYNSATWQQAVYDVLAVRYETGEYLMQQAPKGMDLASLWMQGQTSTFESMLGRLGLVVGEVAKHFGKQIANNVGGATFALVVRDDQTLVVPRLDTPARSEIYSKIDPGVANLYTYYLQGPEGAGDFCDLMAELNAATHALFTAYSVAEWLPNDASITQGEAVLTFMMYIQVYLRHVRENYPNVYAAMQAESTMQDAVKLLWARGLFILNLANDAGVLPALPAKVIESVNNADAIGEIESFVAN